MRMPFRVSRQAARRGSRFRNCCAPSTMTMRNPGVRCGAEMISRRYHPGRLRNLLRHLQFRSNPRTIVLQRMMSSPQQPTYSERDEDGRIGLAFNGITQCILEGRSSLAGTHTSFVGNLRSAVASLAINVLRRASNLVDHTFCLCFGVPGHSAESFLYLSACVP